MLKYYQVYSNDDTVLTLTYFMARSNLAPYAFVWEKSKTMDFSKSFVRFKYTTKFSLPKIACPAIVYAEIVVVIDPFFVGVCP